MDISQLISAPILAADKITALTECTTLALNTRNSFVRAFSVNKEENRSGLQEAKPFDFPLQNFDGIATLVDAVQAGVFVVFKDAGIHPEVLRAAAQLEEISQAGNTFVRRSCLSIETYRLLIEVKPTRLSRALYDVLLIRVLYGLDWSDLEGYVFKPHVWEDKNVDVLEEYEYMAEVCSNATRELQCFMVSEDGSGEMLHQLALLVYYAATTQGVLSRAGISPVDGLERSVRRLAFTLQHLWAASESAGH